MTGTRDSCARMGQALSQGRRRCALHLLPSVRALEETGALREAMPWVLHGERLGHRLWAIACGLGRAEAWRDQLRPWGVIGVQSMVVRAAASGQARDLRC